LDRAYSDDESALPLPPFAGEGWGGVLPQNALVERIDFPPTAAFFERVGVPRKRERWTKSVERPIISNATAL
jgi:hypothetical protein